MIQIDNLSKSFTLHNQGSAVIPVMKDAHLSVAPGECIALTGVSGAGKSTLMRMIYGNYLANAGRIMVGDVDVATAQPREIIALRRETLGYVSQFLRVVPRVATVDVVAEPLLAIGIPADQARDKACHLLQMLNIPERLWSLSPTTFSGGEQQRVALARALAPRPRIMLMDEPFSGLDNRLRDGIRDETLALLKEEDTAVLLVTHEPEEALRMADQIALLRDGKIVQLGAPYNIYNAPVDRYAMAFFSDINIVRGTSHGALTKTIFGDFLTPGYEDGSEVEIAIRPQHLHLDFHRNGNRSRPSPTHGQAAIGVVERARFMGTESLVELRMEDDGSLLKATVPNVFLPKPDTQLMLSLRRDRCFVFPARAEG